MSNAIYASARARALENTLLTVDRLNRMIECQKAEDALKILSEVNFGEGISISSPSDFELLITAEKKKLFRFIKDSAPKDEIKRFFLLENDFFNAQAFLRSKHLKISADKMLMEEGNFDINTLKECIMSDEYSRFPQSLQRALVYLDGEFVAGRATGAKVDAEFYKAYYEELINYAKSDKTLLKIYKCKADFANVSIALRTRNFTKAKEVFVCGGDITSNELKRLCEESEEDLKEIFKFSTNSEIILNGIESFFKGESLYEYEKMCDNYAVQLLKENKYSTEGCLPFIQYCYYKLSDISNVRIIMVGLLNGLSKTEIINKLRDGYEG